MSQNRNKKVASFAYGDCSQEKSRNCEENDTYVPYKKNDNDDFNGKSHGYT